MKQFRNPYHQRPIVTEHVGKMEREKVAEECVSPWNSPLLIVPKKGKDSMGNNQYRVVIDYRKLNGCIEQDKYPLPNIKELLDQLNGSRYFTCMDLSQGYYQVELDKSSRPLTAFSTPDNKHYQLTRLPMGLSTSPSAFSRVMSMALSGLTGVDCLVYLDDIIVFSETEEEHEEKLSRVFDRFRAMNLKVHPGKSHFLQETVIFLGFKIDKTGIRVDPGKYDTIRTYPAPKTRKQMQRFLGLTNFYRQFIDNYAQLSLPLAELLKKGVKYTWSEECETAFKSLKEKLCSDEVLAYPDFEHDFVLSTDASDGAIGAVLSTHDDRPVYFASRLLKGAELRYSVIEKELLAIVYAVKYFRPYLLGRHFTIRTDHAPLRWLYAMTNPASRLTKFRLELEPYNFTVEHISGKNNVVADALSRIHSEDLKRAADKVGKAHEELKQFETVCAMTRAQTRNSKEVQTIDIPQLPKKPKHYYTVMWQTLPMTKLRIIKKVIRLGPNWQEFDAELYDWIKKETIEKMVITLRKSDEFIDLLKWLKERGVATFVIPERMTPDMEERKKILKSAHEHPTAGHAGITKMYKAIKRNYDWRKMHEDIVKHVNGCHDCRKMKHLQQRKTKLTFTTTSTKPFEKVMLDIVGPINIGHQYKYALTLQDDFTKFVVAIPLASKGAEKVAEAFVEKWILKFGCPNTVLTDCGTEFVNALFKEVCKLLKIETETSTPYRHETLGALENSHKSLNNYIRLYTTKNSWWKTLPYFEFAYNSTEHSSTGYSPFEILYGYTVQIPKCLTANTDHVAPPKDYENYVEKLGKTLKIIHGEVLQNVVTRKVERNERENETRVEKDLKIGDEVYVRKEVRTKTDPIRTGPYKIKSVSGKNMTLDNNTVVHEDKINKVLWITTFE